MQDEKKEGNSMSKLLGSWKKILWLQQIDRILWCCNENQCKKDVSHEEFPASSEARMFRVDVAIYAVKNEQNDFFPPCRKRCSLQNAFNRIYSISYAVYSVIITIIVHSGAVGFCMRMLELEYFSFWARDIQGKKNTGNTITTTNGTFLYLIHKRYALFIYE